MIKKIQLYEISLEQLTDVVSAAVKKELSGVSIEIPIKDENLMTRTETIKMLGISSVTLWRYVKDGILVQYKNQGRVYFKRDEVMKAISNS